MKKEEFQVLKNKINELNNKDIYIEFQDALEYYITIYKGKILISKNRLFITNQNKIDILIDLSYLDSIKYINNTIILQLWNNLKIILDS